MPSSLDASGNPFPPSAFLSNTEAARFLNLSPRTLEKLRVIGGGRNSANLVVE